MGGGGGALVSLELLGGQADEVSAQPRLAQGKILTSSGHREKLDQRCGQGRD